MRISQALIASATLLILTGCAPAASQTAPATDTGSSSSENSSSASSEKTIAIATGASLKEELLESGILEIGEENAPVSMLLFTNYSCGYCLDFHDHLYSKLLTEYVSVGKVRLGIVPLAMQKYPQSLTTAALMLCSAKQKKGKLMHDLLFTELDEKKLQKEISALGLTMDALQQCIASDDLKVMLSSEEKYALSFGISLAPSYVINNRKFTGLPEWADLRGQIEEALRTAR